VASSRHGGVELVGKHDGERHVLGGLVGSVTEPGRVNTAPTAMKTSTYMIPWSPAPRFSRRSSR
jgi:hypothetical protein